MPAAHLILLQQEACVGPRQGEAGLGVGRVRGAGGAHHLHLLAIDGSHNSVTLLGIYINNWLHDSVRKLVSLSHIPFVINLYFVSKSVSVCHHY